MPQGIDMPCHCLTALGQAVFFDSFDDRCNFSYNAEVHRNVIIF